MRLVCDTLPSCATPSHLEKIHVLAANGEPTKYLLAPSPSLLQSSRMHVNATVLVQFVLFEEQVELLDGD